MILRRPLRVVCIMLSLLCCACRQRRGGELIDGLFGYETIPQVRDQLTRIAPSERWTQESEHRDQTDRRPPHDIVYLLGEFQHLGQRGRLRLTFYNNRLMTAEFWPFDGGRYMAALREKGFPTPPSPGTEIRIGTRTSFAYYTKPGGEFRCVWEDVDLAREFSDWVAKYA
jgi:hypothetical protein